MHISIPISDSTAAWLHQQARLMGVAEASVAADALERLASRVSPAPSSDVTLDEWKRRLDRFAASVKPRPGPFVDASRDSIYD